MLPGLLPAAAALNALAEAGNSLPSADYPFDKLAVQTLDHAEMRHVLKGKLATGEALEVHETTLSGRHPLLTLRTVTCTPRCGSFVKARWSSRSTEPAIVWVQRRGFVHSNDEHGSRMSADCRQLFRRGRGAGRGCLIPAFTVSFGRRRV